MAESHVLFASPSPREVHLKVGAEFAEGRKEYHFARRGYDRFGLESPRMLVGDVDGVQAHFHGWIDVAAGAVADHPAVGLDDFLLVHEPAGSLRVFFLA